MGQESEAKPSRWEPKEAFDERRQNMFVGTPDATEHARSREPRGRTRGIELREWSPSTSSSVGGTQCANENDAGDVLTDAENA